jgi:hypothetical protein
MGAFFFIQLQIIIYMKSWTLMASALSVEQGAFMDAVARPRSEGSPVSMEPASSSGRLGDVQDCEFD